MNIRPITALVTALALATPVFAQEQTVEDQLRQALRDVTVQLRQAQTDLGVAQAELESAREDNEDLQGRLEKLAQESAAEQKAMQENINNLNAQLEKETAEANRLADLLVKWKAAYSKMKTVAQAEGARKENLSEDLGALRNEVAQLKTDNRELFRIGMEILERYENFGLGKALTAREPFTGITRTRLQTLVQDYRDELLDNRIELPTADQTTAEPGDDSPKSDAVETAAPSETEPEEDSTEAKPVPSEETLETEPDPPTESSEESSRETSKPKKIFLR